MEKSIASCMLPMHYLDSVVWAFLFQMASLSLLSIFHALSPDVLETLGRQLPGIAVRMNFIEGKWHVLEAEDSICYWFVLFIGESLHVMACSAGFLGID